jgi:hypothetical protein
MDMSQVDDKVHNIRGFSRVQITNPKPDGTEEIVGDSGWTGPNTITDLGFLQYLNMSLGGSAGAKSVAYIALGTGSAPNASHVTLDGEISASTKRTTVTFATANSRSAQFTATFSSSASFLASASTLSNVGLYNATTSDATLFAGNTFTASSCNSNQNVNVTYTIKFS